MSKPTDRWISTTAIAAELGLTPKFLREHRTEYFKAVTHYRLINPNAYRPTYQWHKERCVARWNKLTKEADAVERSQEPAAVRRGEQLAFVPNVDSYSIN